MVRGVGSDDQFTGHEGMQITAGFGAAKNKFSRPLRPEFDGRHLAPIPMQVILVLKPVMLAESSAFSGDEFDGIAVQLQTVGDIRGGEPQNYGIALVDNDAPRRISKPAGVDRNMARGGSLWYLRDTQRNQHSQFKTEENKKNSFFFAHFHKNMISGELRYLQLGKAGSF